MFALHVLMAKFDAKMQSCFDAYAMMGRTIALPARLKIRWLHHCNCPDNLLASPPHKVPSCRARSIFVSHFLTLSADGQQTMPANTNRINVAAPAHWSYNPPALSMRMSTPSTVKGFPCCNLRSAIASCPRQARTRRANTRALCSTFSLESALK